MDVTKLRTKKQRARQKREKIPKFDHDELVNIAHLLRSGYTLESIAKAHTITYHSMRKRLIRAGSSVELIKSGYLYKSSILITDKPEFIPYPDN
jgi:hypothetical protein